MRWTLSYFFITLFSWIYLEIDGFTFILPILWMKTSYDDHKIGFRHKISCSFQISNQESIITQTSSLDRDIVPVKASIDYEIRPATFHELSSVAKLRINVFYPQYLGASSFQARILDKLRQRVDYGSICLIARATDMNQIRSLPQHMYFGNLIGTVEISPNDFFNTSMESLGSSRKLYAADLAVREDCRRLGVASRLLQEMETFAITHCFDEIYLHVEVGNSIARNMYLKHGYVEVPMNEKTVLFTEARLQKPAEFYCLLWKEIWWDKENQSDSFNIRLKTSL